MKRSLLSLFVCFALAGFLACGSSSGDRNAIIKEATQYFSVLAQTLVQFFQNDLTSCDNFQTIFDQLSTDVFDCDNGAEGQFNLIKTSSSCTGGSPLVAMANFVLEFNNCADNPNDVTTTGPISFSLNFTRTENFVLVTTPGALVNGLNFFTDNMDVEIKFSSGNLNCEGNLTVDGEECGIRSNCENCQ